MLSRCLTWAVVLLALRKSADCFYLHRARDIELLVGMANEFVLEGGGVDRYFKLLAHLNEWEDLDGKDWNYKVEIIFGQTDCLYQPIRFDFKTVFFHDKHCQFVEDPKKFRCLMFMKDSDKTNLHPSTNCTEISYLPHFTD